jgi:hypothetical protein
MLVLQVFVTLSYPPSTGKYCQMSPLLLTLLLTIVGVSNLAWLSLLSVIIGKSLPAQSSPKVYAVQNLGQRHMILRTSQTCLLRFLNIPNAVTAYWGV